MASLLEMQKEDQKNGNEVFVKTIEEFADGKISVPEYKSFSGKYGTFAERGKETSMLRLRNSCGSISPEKLRFVVDEAKKYGVETLHFATCQTIQFHHLKPEQVIAIMADASANNFITYGTGGDYPRNIMCSPLSGIDPDEIMDVMPYAREAAKYLTRYLEDPKMPRKLKTAFAGDRFNSTHVTYRDLGFEAQEDGTFDVYCAGGLGPNPRFGVLVAQHVDPTDILYHVQAMINTFKKYGNAKDKAKARTRYMIEDLGGEDAFRDAYTKELDAIKDDPKLKIRPETLQCCTKSGNGTVPKPDPRVKAQKQNGLYYVEYHPIGGKPDLETLDKLCAAIEPMAQVELHNAPDQTVYIVNLTGEEADVCAAITRNDTARNEFEKSVACVGGHTCQVGLRDSQGVLHELVDAMRQANVKDDALPKIHISGCPSSCSGQQTAVIGLQGTIKMEDKCPKPAFLITLHGRNGRRDSKMGVPAGRVLESDLVSLFSELAETVEQSGMPFDAWYENDPKALDELVAKYVNEGC